MDRDASREVHGRLSAWADSQRPVPSSALAQYMGPLRPVSAAASAAGPARHAGRSAVVRAGLTLKLVVAGLALAMTGAAAVGLAHVVAPAPGPAGQTPALGVRTSEPGRSGPTPSASGRATTAAASPSGRATTSSASPSPSPSRHPAAASPTPSPSPSTGAPAPSRTPTTRPSAHATSPSDEPSGDGPDPSASGTDGQGDGGGDRTADPTGEPASAAPVDPGSS